MDLKSFQTGIFATLQADLTATGAKGLGQKSNQVTVCLAFDRWCGDPDFVVIAIRGDKTVPACTGLNFHE